MKFWKIRRFLGKLTMAVFEQKRRLAGVICLVSDMDKDGIDMFDIYKGRERMWNWHLIR